MSLDQLVDQKEIPYPLITYLHGSGKKFNKNNFLLNRMIKKYQFTLLPVVVTLSAYNGLLQLCPA